MPIYEYYCKECLEESDVRSSEYLKESEMSYKCPKCGSENTKRIPAFPARWVFCDKGAYRQDEMGWNSDSPDWNYTRYLLQWKRDTLKNISECTDQEELERLKLILLDVNEKLGD